MTGPIAIGGLVLLPSADRLPEIGWVEQIAVSVLPEHSRGWMGRPGLIGHRLDGGAPAWSPAFTDVRIDATDDRTVVRAVDPVAGLRLVSEFEALAGGAVRGRHAVTNTAAGRYAVDALDVVVPVPDQAGEILDFTGRWAFERQPQRHPIADGLWLRENRRGRTGHDAATVMVAGTPGFGFGHGSVWAVHVAWSGNHVHRVERLPSGEITLGGGELLLPGEVVLEPGETYRTPWVYLAASSAGLDDVSAAFHARVRAARPLDDPRPVMLNVWEAVYFDHDLDRLTALAETAARIGVERFVLDDGWFAGRRDDTAGLGDWTVDPTVWPDGLHPLVRRVTALGMDFGLWWEPEMVNPDSALYRAHPDWILSTGGRVPPLERNQLVLDLTNPAVTDHLLHSFGALAAEYPISFVKWDHNRDLVDAGSALRGGAPAVHGQTVAFYALVDELRRRHPEIEWESCASGGARIDLEALARFDSVWTSDGTDPLTRQHVQRWTGLLVPPEFLGAHVAAARSHQTGRTSSLSFRAATALFGQFGIQWNLAEASAAELNELAEWIAIYKRHRALLHSGRVVRADLPETGVYVHGVVAADRRSALMAYVQLDETVHPPPAFRVPRLEAHTTYRAAEIAPEPTGWAGHGATATGAVLDRIGLPGSRRAPQSVLVVHLVAT
jgi:alpha-galactosidase